MTTLRSLFFVQTNCCFVCIECGLWLPIRLGDLVEAPCGIYGLCHEGRNQNPQFEERKEKFTLFSHHNGSLLRRQPEASLSSKSCMHDYDSVRQLLIEIQLWACKSCGLALTQHDRSNQRYIEGSVNHTKLSIYRFEFRSQTQQAFVSGWPLSLTLIHT